MLDFLGCTPSIRALQARVLIALPLVALIQTSYAIAPKMCGTFFPQLPGSGMLGVLTRESVTGKGPTFSRAAIQLTQEQASAPAVRFRHYAKRLGSNRAEAIR
jgi:hypothetical protein